MTDIRIGSMVMEDHGEGDPVIMIHGLGGTSNSFQPLMESLEGYRVLRPDLPGVGRSALKPGRPGIKGLVAAVSDFMKAAGIERAHFVGHSMGTLIAQHCAVAAPQAVASMTLFGPLLEPPLAARQGLKERAADARANGMAAIADAISNGSVDARSRKANPASGGLVRESLLRQDPAGYATHCEILSEAQAADLAKISCPTLLIAGENDPVTPVAMAQKIKQGITGSRLEIVPQIGHWIMVEAPENSARLLRSHLDENGL